MEREELLKSREYWITKIQIEMFEMIENYITEKKINRTQLAKELNFTKSYISQVLNGDFNYKISTLVDMALAVGKVPILKFEDEYKYIENDELGINNLPEKEQENLAEAIKQLAKHSKQLIKKG